MNRKAIYLSESLVEDAMKKVQNESTLLPGHFEHYYRLGVLAEQYEDLPISMIKSLMESTKEEANLAFIPE
jgi:hypothetical protein